LHPNPDGSVSIYISQIKPAGVPEANWLPVSDRPFNLMLRVYGVEQGSSVANNTYIAPPVVATGPAPGSGGGSSASCDPLLAACGGAPAGTQSQPTLAPSTGSDSGTAIGTAQMPNLRSRVTAHWRDDAIRARLTILVSRPRLAGRSLLARVSIPALDISEDVRIRLDGTRRVTTTIMIEAPVRAIGKLLTVRLDPSNVKRETRERDNVTRARIR